VYTLPSRIAFAGWTDKDIDSYKYGYNNDRARLIFARGPSPQVVSGLAENTRLRLASDYAISESGTAGPTSGKRNITPYGLMKKGSILTIAVDMLQLR
jgi:hypothetical protein